MPRTPSAAAGSFRRLRAGSSIPLRVAVDTGGTFTDCVWVEGGRVRSLKVFSTPEDPARAIVEALEKIAGPPDSRAGKGAIVLLHGTTVGTNTLLERKGRAPGLRHHRGR